MYCSETCTCSRKNMLSNVDVIQVILLCIMDLGSTQYCEHLKVSAQTRSIKSHTGSSLVKTKMFTDSILRKRPV